MPSPLQRDLPSLAHHAQVLLGPDEPVIGAYFAVTPTKAYAAWFAGCMTVGVLNLVNDLLLSPFRRRRERAVAVTERSLAVLGGFDAHGFPTTVIERMPRTFTLPEPDWTPGDVTVIVGDHRLWVDGVSIDEARRLARLPRP